MTKVERLATIKQCFAQLDVPFDEQTFSAAYDLCRTAERGALIERTPDQGDKPSKAMLQWIKELWR